MKKRMVIMLICMAVLFGCIFLYKGISKLMLSRAMSKQTKIIPVSVMKVEELTWQPKLSASGSLRAIHGVNVTTELAGMVQKIFFEPGAVVKQNDILVQLNADSDIAQLQSLEANVSLAQTTYQRDKAQYAIHAVSKQVVDVDMANLQGSKAKAAEQAAVVAKKTIRAPFAGRLGINNINLGQYINPGDKVVSLQTLNPIYFDFYMPQQVIGQLKVGQSVSVTSDAFPDRTFPGKITTIDPAVNIGSRNIELEATIENPKEELMPGMFGTIDVITGKPAPFITVPQTAITFNPYGSIIYVVQETGKDDQGKPILTVAQKFVTTGEKRGEQIKIIRGIKKGDLIVTSGQLKLKNGSQVRINDQVEPSDRADPILNNNH